MASIADVDYFYCSECGAKKTDEVPYALCHEDFLEHQLLRSSNERLRGASKQLLHQMGIDGDVQSACADLAALLAELDGKKEEA